MTPLPKHLEEMRDEKANECIKELKNFFYASKEDMQKDAYLSGFNQAASILLKNMESMANALELLPKKIENKSVSFRAHKIIDAHIEEALKIWREKYTTKVEGSKG